MTTEIPLTRPRSLGRSLNFATGAANALCQAILGRHGVTLAQWVVLLALWQRNGLRLSDIARFSGNDGPATSRIVDRMIEKGLLERRPDPEDRRAVVIVLSPQGEGLRHLSDFHDRLNGILMDGLSPEEADRLLALLERVEATARAALSNVAGDG